MKQKVALLLSIVMLLSMGLYGCKKEEKEKLVLEISNSYVTPDYEYQLYLSDDVIYGEVIEELEGYHTNPDRNNNGIINSWITPYVVKIEKSYKGLLKEGDTVVVNTRNKTGIYPGDEEKYAQIITDQKEFYLQEGQRSVFMLQRADYLETDDSQPMYTIVYRDEGVFEPKETGIATMGEEAKTVYVSPSFEITLDQIPKDIEKLVEVYGYKSMREDPDDTEI